MAASVVSSTEETPIRKGSSDESQNHKSERVHSVLRASGLLIDPSKKHRSVLPERHDGSTKASISWLGTTCLRGVGLFIEAYIIITVGQIKTIWSDQYPTCWVPDEAARCPANIECSGLFPNTPADGVDGWAPDTAVCDQDGNYPSDQLCSKAVLSATSFGVFAGFMVGMIVIGAAADTIGRKMAGTINSVIMLAGIAVMTYVDAPNPNVLFAVWSAFFSFFGIGLGGEYPLSATSSAENHAKRMIDARLDDDERHRQRVQDSLLKAARRGENMTISKSMQSLGGVFGSLVLLSLIYFGLQSKVNCEDPRSNSSGNDPEALDGIWRTFFFFGLIQILGLLIYRFVIAEESDSFKKVEERRKSREARLGKNSTWKILKFYWPQLVATSGTIFLWDIGNYGLKLFSGPIFDAINPSGGLLVNNSFILFYNVLNLVGNIGCAFLIDRKFCGRVKLQIFGFAATGALLVVAAVVYNIAPAGVILFLYLASALFGGVGPNVTTYIMAAETFPTELRGTCHGISSFAGKFSALIATIVFTYIDVISIFYLTGATCLIAAGFTWVFSSDMIHLSLAEHDAQLELFLEGRVEKYKGRLNKHEHLSNYQRWTGRHGAYSEDWVKTFIAEECEAGTSQDDLGDLPFIADILQRNPSDTLESSNSESATGDL